MVRKLKLVTKHTGNGNKHIYGSPFSAKHRHRRIMDSVQKKLVNSGVKAYATNIMGAALKEFAKLSKDKQIRLLEKENLRDTVDLREINNAINKLNLRY